MTEHLSMMGIRTAWDLAQADAWTLRTKFNVVIEKTARELRGTPLPGARGRCSAETGDLLQPDVRQAAV